MFRRLSFFAVSLGFVVGGAVASAQSGIQVGEARSVVIERLGPPQGTAQVGVREVLYYPQGTVVLVEGKFERATFSSRPSPVAGAVGSPAAATAAAAAGPRAPTPWPAPAGWPGSAAGASAPGRAGAGASDSSTAAAPVSATEAAPTRAVAPGVEGGVSATVVKPKAAVTVAGTKDGKVGAARPTTVLEWWRPTMMTLWVSFVVMAGGSVWLRWWWRGRPRRQDLTAALLSVDAPVGGSSGGIGRRGKASTGGAEGDDADAAVPEPVWPEVDTSVWSMALLRALEWHRFEEVVAEYFRRLGYRAELTGFGPDGGVDVVVSRLTESSPCVLVQCKAWRTDVIGVRLVRELYGVAAARGIKACAFFTTSTFHAEALAFAGPVAMDCVDGAEVLKRILALPAEDQAALLAVATAGDFRTPTCCACGIKMVPRARPTSGVFFGCRNYPRCRQTLEN